MAKNDKNVFTFRGDGHAIFQHKGHEFPQHQEFIKFYEGGKLVRSEPQEISNIYPLKYAFWGGESLTANEIESRLVNFPTLAKCHEGHDNSKWRPAG